MVVFNEINSKDSYNLRKYPLWYCHDFWDL